MERIKKKDFYRCRCSA